MNDPRYLHTEEKQEGETFFDVMNRLIARSKAVTADMEAVLAELESEIEPFRAQIFHRIILLNKRLLLLHIKHPWEAFSLQHSFLRAFR